MKAALLDTNVPLALAWPNHQHHAQAHAWFAAGAKKGWATCTFTQLGFIRLSSNPAYTAGAVAPQEAALLLQQWIRIKSHPFWTSPTAEAPRSTPGRSDINKSTTPGWSRRRAETPVTSSRWTRVCRFMPWSPGRSRSLELDPARSAMNPGRANAEAPPASCQDLVCFSVSRIAASKRPPTSQKTDGRQQQNDGQPKELRPEPEPGSPARDQSSAGRA